jgi:serine/threonine-protein kinase
MEATQLVRPSGSGRVGLIGTAVVCAALAAGVIVFLMMPRTGRINVTVADAKGTPVDRVEIFVDGKKQCDTVPCMVDQVTAGSHQVKVLAQGYDSPQDRAIVVESRKDSAIDFALTAASKGTGLKVSGKQAGVQLSIDGKTIGPLPQELHDLTPGAHQVHLAGSERYAPLDKNVIVAQDEIQDLGEQTLKVVKGKATIQLDTPGARVSIVSGSDRREFPTLPIAVDLDTLKPWALEASKPGFADYHQAVTFEDGQAEKTFSIHLDPKSAPTFAASNNTPAPAPQPAPKPVAVAAAPRPAAAPKAAKESADDSAPAPASGDAFLNINSIPASSVIVDGKPIGNTPKVHFQVSPGSHTVVFVNSDEGLKKQIAVNVGAGETKPAIAKLRE